MELSERRLLIISKSLSEAMSSYPIAGRVPNARIRRWQFPAEAMSRGSIAGRVTNARICRREMPRSRSEVLCRGIFRVARVTNYRIRPAPVEMPSGAPHSRSICVTDGRIIVVRSEHSLGGSARFVFQVLAMKYMLLAGLGTPRLGI